jgi:dipicolinate synthase subunit A
MFINTTSSHNGLFGNNQGTVFNLILKDSWIGGGDYTAGIAGANGGTIDGVKNHDIVFNTVPSLILTNGVLKNTDRNTLIIDLASIPGGVDFEAAGALGIDAYRALSLPGKCSPKAAGEIIKKTVCTILS